MVRKKETSLSDLLSGLASGINRIATRPDANSYVPHDKQVKFHDSKSRGRLYIGGNRSGKTVGGVVEDIWWLLGTHPYRETPKPPLRGRLVCVDFPNGFEKIIKPTITQWIPPSCLIDGSWESSYNSRTRTLTLANGSFLEFMSYDQDLDAFAGASRHFTHFDEEPPSAVWKECRARLIDTGGDWWITMTPVEGMTWVYDKIYEPFKKGFQTAMSEDGLPGETRDVIEVDMEENTYLSPVEIQSFIADLEPEERKARKSGKFVQMGGLIFKTFDYEKHVIPSFNPKTIPPGWRIIASLDHGFNNPTAWLFHAVSPSNVVVTFAEHYRSEWTIPKHVEQLRKMEVEFGRRADFYIGDPAIRQRSGINGNSILLEYSLKGYPVKPSNNDVKVGIARMQGYIDEGHWFITESCPKLIWEMRRYKWKTRESRKLQEKHGNYDEPHKKDDHAVDSSRYFFVSLPELAPTLRKIDYKREKEEIQLMLKGVPGRNLDLGYTDPFWAREPKANAYKYNISTDEYMGGIW
jgi:phage terminase large subunit-like protein